mgnify:CR=1 FL=1
MDVDNPYYCSVKIITRYTNYWKFNYSQFREKRPVFVRHYSNHVSLKLLKLCYGSWVGTMNNHIALNMQYVSPAKDINAGENHRR